MEGLVVGENGHAKEKIEEKGKEVEKSGGMRKNRSLVFNVSLFYNLVKHSKKRRPWWSRLDDDLVMGALPFTNRSHLERLTKEERIGAVVTMNQEHELLPNYAGKPVSPDDWKKANVLQYFGSTPDFQPPTIETVERCVAFVADAVSKKLGVYIHCKAGRGRSTVVAMAYYVKHKNMTAAESYEFVKKRRPHVSLSEKQRQIVQEIEKKCRLENQI